MIRWPDNIDSNLKLEAIERWNEATRRRRAEREVVIWCVIGIVLCLGAAWLS